MKRLSRLIFCLILMISCTAVLGNPGKLAGTVKDKTTGNPLIGANVFIKGLLLGSTTDADGFFFILNVPPGEYELQAQYIGYHTFTISEVLVRSDLTTKVNFEMESEAIESPTVNVVAEKELIQQDLTSTRRVTTREEFITTPGLDQVEDIFRVRSGLVQDFYPTTTRLSLDDGSALQVRDESLSDIHVRGGRGGEILFMVDGMPVTHPIYGGRDVLNLNVQEVEQIEFLTGAFSAQYGQAQSGVVNITTRAGGEKTTGGLEYKTDQVNIFGDTYNQDIGSFHLGGPLFGKNGALSFVEVPGDIYYFVSGNVNLSDTRLNNGRNREILFSPFDLRERQENDRSLNAKVTWNFTPTISLTAAYNGAFKTWSQFDWLWVFFPDNTSEFSRNTQNLNLRLNHVLSSKTYYNFNIGFLEVDFNGSLDGQSSITDFWTVHLNDTTGLTDSVTTVLNPPIRNPDTGFFTEQGSEDIFRDDFTKTFTAKFDIASQVNKYNLLKAGFQVQYNDLNYIDIQGGGTHLSNFGETVFFEDRDPVPQPPGPFPEFGLTRWVFRAFPITGGIYIEDKFEREGLIFNAGLRADWIYKGKSVNDEEWKEVWEAATGFPADWNLFDIEISPRLGISFPVRKSTVAFFSYGHFFQLPQMDFFYRDPYTGGFTGNPGLKYERTILYEFGFTQLLSRNIAIDFKAFQRSITNQVGTTQLLANLGLPVQLYDNKGNARARGIEIELTKRYSNHTAGSIAYTAQWATGFTSSPYENFIRDQLDIPPPIRETTLDWDVRHQVIANLSLISPKGRPMSVFGLKMWDNWVVTALVRVATGRPYTPGTRDIIEANLIRNSENLPITIGVDLKVQQTIDLWGLSLDLFADMFNIFNRANPPHAGFINPWTGQPFTYGDVIEDSQQFFTWRQNVLRQDPRQLAESAHIQLGIRMRF